MEYYSAMKKDTLPFATAWMNLEGIMLSEISQREKDKYYTISHVASKKSKCIETDTETIVTKGWGWGKRGDVDQRVQTSSCKTNKFWGSNVQHSDYS